jgi:hypothetical protein
MAYGGLKMKNFYSTLIFALALLPSTLAAADFLTDEDPFITLGSGVPADSSVLAIISSGESLGDFTFQGLPDGIGLAPGLFPDTIDVFVAHEETTVPFFDTADFQDASISRLTLDTVSAGVTDASVALPASAGFLRFCSAFMAGPAEGYSYHTFFTGEETNDIVPVPAGAPYGPDPAIAPLRQGGYAVALDVHTGNYTQIAGLGRFNHENTVTIPGGWNGFTLLSTDDTFNAPSSQLYMYRANHESHIWQDKGSLWAFQVTRTNAGPVEPDDPFNNANDYLDLQPGDDWRGKFIRVPKEIARGLTGEAPQQALEDWSNQNNVFQFIRLEDLAYDRNNPRIVYAADTGASRVVPNPDTGRMQRGPRGTVGFADNGRIFKFVFNRKNPRKVDSFSVFADGDARGTPEFVPMTSPDNIETSMYSLMVQEDTSGALIWNRNFDTGAWSVVASVIDPGGESSGIVDASEWFGSGSWILDVQAHSTDVVSEFDPDTGVTSKLESGQLILMTIPGT